MVGDLPSLLDEIRECRLCSPVLPVEPRPVLQVHHKARLLIASQAPGRAVFETGIPFNDPSGVRLREWLGVTRDEFYDRKSIAIVPMGFCYPGRGASGDLPPRKECAAKWRASLLAYLGSIELIVAVGSYAVVYHTGSRASLTDNVRSWRDWSPKLIPVPHPSPRNTHWLQSNPWFEDEVIPALRLRVREVLDANTPHGEFPSQEKDKNE